MRSPITIRNALVLKLISRVESFIIPKTVRGMERFESGIPGVAVYSDEDCGSVRALLDELKETSGRPLRLLQGHPVSIVLLTSHPSGQLFLKHYISSHASMREYGPRWVVVNATYRAFVQRFARKGIPSCCRTRKRIRGIFDRRILGGIMNRESVSI